MDQDFLDNAMREAFIARFGECVALGSIPPEVVVDAGPAFFKAMCDLTGRPHPVSTLTINGYIEVKVLFCEGAYLRPLEVVVTARPMESWPA